MTRRPAAMCVGRGHVVVHGNAGFVESFGAEAIGRPLRESVLDLPPMAFELLDAVYAEARPMAVWLPVSDGDWRLTAAPRLDPETGEVYGVMLHLRARSDVPVLEPSPRP